MSSSTTPTKGEKTTTDKTPGTTSKADSDSATREVAQDQTDRVAIVSRTATGQAHQHPGYEVIGLPDGATEAQKAAAENRPAQATKS